MRRAVLLASPRGRGGGLPAASADPEQVGIRRALDHCLAGHATGDSAHVRRTGGEWHIVNEIFHTAPEARP